jgi:hypothetical protein
MALLTTLAITRLAVRLFKNSNDFIRNIDTQYSDEFAVEGAKIGDTLRIRLPNDYTVTDGPALSAQETNEQSTSLVVNTQRHVDTTFTAAQLSLSMQDFSERVAAPVMNNLAGNIAKTVMLGLAEGGVSNFVANTDGNGAIISPVAQTLLDAGALLTTRSAQRGNRTVTTHQNTMARLVGTMQGLFNPAPDISRQYRKAMIYDALNFRWFEDPTVLLHTTGTFTAGTVNGAGQSGLTLTVNAITGTFKKGDIITIAGVNSVNRVTKQDDGVLQQFVVTADVATAATSVPIYPAIVAPATSGPAAGQDVQYQTCASSPANGAALALVNTASEKYRKNIAYVPEFATLATCDLKLPTGNGQAARANSDGLALRVIRNFYNVQTDSFVDRVDCLFGYLAVRPEWAVALADVA